MKLTHSNKDPMQPQINKFFKKTKSITKNKEGHYIMIKQSIQEEDVILINIYVPNIGAPKYIKQVLTDRKGDINNNTVIVGDFNTSLTSMDIIIQTENQ